MYVILYKKKHKKTYKCVLKKKQFFVWSVCPSCLTFTRVGYWLKNCRSKEKNQFSKNVCLTFFDIYLTFLICVIRVLYKCQTLKYLEYPETLNIRDICTS